MSSFSPATPIAFGYVGLNDGAAYSNNNGQFVAPANGVYHFDASLILTSASGASVTALILVNNVLTAGVLIFNTGISGNNYIKDPQM